MVTHHHAVRIVTAALAVTIAACSADGPDVTGPATSSTPSDEVPASTAHATAPVSTPPTTSEPPTSAGPATLTAEPSTGIRDGQIVAVTARGLRTPDTVVVGLCLDDDPLAVDDCEPAVSMRPEGRFVRALTGELDTRVRIPAVFTARSGVVIDCRDPVTECLLVAASIFAEDPLTGPQTALGFDPSAPLADPGVAISVDRDLHDGQPVGVAAWGFEPGAPVAIGQCRVVDGEPEACETEVAVFAPRRLSDDSGRLDATVGAQVEFEAYEHDDPVSCRPPTDCELLVETSPSGIWNHPTLWRFPLRFDPDAPLAAPPDVTVAPATALVDGQQIEITSSAPLGSAHSLLVAQCAGPPGPESCATATAHVTFDVDFAEPLITLARARLTLPGGRTVDCRPRSGTCYVAVTPSFQSPPRRWGTAELDFDPVAPLAPPPSLRLVGGPEFVDREYATVVGDGFVPGSGVVAAQCATGRFVPGSCSAAGMTAATADGDGRVEISRPMLATAGPADCGRAGACEVRVATDALLLGGFDEHSSAAAPVVVGPLVADERYLEPVFDEIERRHGIVYGRGRDNDGELVDLTLDLFLPRDDEATARPVLLAGGDHALEFAHRGFVVVETNLDVRASRESIELAYVNTVPVLAWLDDHAEELRIDTDRIAAAGQSRGGFLSTSLAYAPVAANGEPPVIAAAVSMAGGSVTDLIEAGEPPALMIHGDDDGRVPVEIAEATCDAAHAVGVRCELVVYAGRGHEVGVTNDLIYDIWDRIARFLVDVLDLR